MLHHLVNNNCHVNALKVALNGLPPNHQIELLDITDDNGRSTYDIACKAAKEGKGDEQHISHKVIQHYAQLHTSKILNIADIKHKDIIIVILASVSNRP